MTITVMVEYVERNGLSTPLLSNGVSRRDFLAFSARVALAAVAMPVRNLWAGASAASTRPAPKMPDFSAVEIFTSQRVLDGLRVRPKWLGEMIDGCLLSLSGKSTARAAWGEYVQPGQRILLKFTSVSGAELHTDQAILATLLTRLRAAGHKLSDIMVADCRFAAEEPGLAPTPPGWSQRTIRVGRHDQQLRRYLRGIDAIINVPTLTDHNLAGLSGAMMNVALPFIRQPGHYLDKGIHEAIVSICAASQVIPLTALTLVNALRCVYDGGPFVREENTVCTHSIWAASDMVAVDRLALDWIDQQRRQHKLQSLSAAGRPATYITLATQRQLGHGDPRRIIRRRHFL